MNKKNDIKELELKYIELFKERPWIFRYLNGLNNRLK